MGKTSPGGYGQTVSALASPTASRALTVFDGEKNASLHTEPWQEVVPRVGWGGAATNNEKAKNYHTTLSYRHNMQHSTGDTRSYLSVTSTKHQ